MLPAPDKIDTDDNFCQETDVVVIGGGIIGVSAALFLRRKGLRVTLCDKGHIACEQSSRNWGWVRVMGRDPREIPLAIASQRIWEDFSEREGLDTGFVRNSILYVFDTPQMRDTYTSWIEHAREHQLPTRLLSRKELQQLLPGINRHIDGGLLTPSDARAEPQKGASAIARIAQREGVAIKQNCAVRGIDIAGGKVCGVITELGRITAGSVLLAGGTWSRLMLGNHGVDFPQLSVRGTVMRVESSANVPELTVGGSNFAYRRRADGGYTVAQPRANISELTPDSFRLFADFLPTLRSEWRDVRIRVGRRSLEELRRKRYWSMDETTVFEDVRVLDPVPHPGVVASAVANLQRAMPAFQDARVTTAWAGMIDVTPDAVPVIGPVPAIPGLFAATGFSGHGFGIGPGAGRLAADLINGDAPLVGPHPFRFDRFARTRMSSN